MVHLFLGGVFFCRVSLIEALICGCGFSLRRVPLHADYAIPGSLLSTVAAKEFMRVEGFVGFLGLGFRGL